jgi:hypothetical protein
METLLTEHKQWATRRAELTRRDANPTPPWPTGADWNQSETDAVALLTRMVAVLERR